MSGVNGVCVSEGNVAKTIGFTTFAKKELLWLENWGLSAPVLEPQRVGGPESHSYRRKTDICEANFPPTVTVKTPSRARPRETQGE